MGVLQGPWKGVPTSSRWLRDNVSALRLQRRLCELDGRVECGQEGLVLQSRGQGLPTGSRWLRLSTMIFVKCCKSWIALAFAPSSGVIQFLLHLARVFLVLCLVMGKQSHLALAHAPSSGAW